MQGGSGKEEGWMGAGQGSQLTLGSEEPPPAGPSALPLPTLTSSSVAFPGSLGAATVARLSQGRIMTPQDGVAAGTAMLL